VDEFITLTNIEGTAQIKVRWANINTLAVVTSEDGETATGVHMCGEPNAPFFVRETPNEIIELMEQRTIRGSNGDFGIQSAAQV